MLLLRLERGDESDDGGMVTSPRFTSQFFSVSDYFKNNSDILNFIKLIEFFFFFLYFLVKRVCKIIYPCFVFSFVHLFSDKVIKASKYTFQKAGYW